MFQWKWKFSLWSAIPLCSVWIWYWLETNGPWGDLSCVSLEGKVEGREVFLETPNLFAFSDSSVFSSIEHFLTLPPALPHPPTGFSMMQTGVCVLGGEWILRSQCPGLNVQCLLKAASTTSSKALCPSLSQLSTGSSLCSSCLWQRLRSLVLIPVWQLGRDMVTEWVPQRLAFGRGGCGWDWGAWILLLVAGFVSSRQSAKRLEQLEPLEGGRGEGQRVWNCVGGEEVGRHWEEGGGQSLGNPQREQQLSEASEEGAGIRVILCIWGRFDYVIKITGKFAHFFGVYS